MKKTISLLIFLSLLGSFSFAQPINTDVLVVGGGTGGTAAGIQSARLKAKTIVAEPTPWLGGMLTAAGVSATDGNDELHSGIWEEFRQQLYKHYGTRNLGTGWVSNTLFEPHVGDSIFKVLCAREEKYLTIMHGLLLKSVIRNGRKITGAVFTGPENKIVTIYSKVCIDATETGDLIAMSGAAYDIGMEDATYSGESIAPGKNNIIQDLTWAAILKDYGSLANKTIPRPAGYDSTKFFRSCLSRFCKDSTLAIWSPEKMLNYGKIRNGKYMINWPVRGNDFYLNVLEDSYAERNKKYAEAKNHTLQFIYYIQKDLGFRNLGFAEDEFPTADRLPFIPYNRESRRMKGIVRLRNEDLARPFEQVSALYKTGVAVGDYPIDHHHSMNGAAPPISFTPILPYTIPLGCLVPEKTEGLIAAEKNISVSNIVNGTTRLQPVVLLTGQAAGALAAYCIRKSIQPRDADVRDVQQILLDARCYLMPYSDMKPDDVYWEVCQKAGLTGIFKGKGLSRGWENKMYFEPDSLATREEFLRGMIELGFDCKESMQGNDRWLTGADIMNVYVGLVTKKKIAARSGEETGLAKYNITKFNMFVPLTRKVAAVIADHLLDLFASKKIKLTGAIDYN